MRGLFVFVVLSVLPGVVPIATAQAQSSPAYERKQDVVYGRKFGTALTLDVFTPKEKANGVGLIWVVSGGWFSSHDAITGNPGFVTPFLDRGYTVFAVVHGSNPKFAIPEVIADMRRSVRFIRTHAKEYSVDPERLGVYGGSAGGHLSLMIGTTSDPGKPNDRDVVERASSRVQAVACFFPPTDFLNYGKSGEIAIGRGVLEPFKAAFEFQELDTTRRVFVPVVDEAERLKIARAISPAYHVSPDDPPTLIIHGDADKLVPIQQAELIIAKLQQAHVPAKLVVKPGAGHGWPDLTKDYSYLVEWFDEHLKPAKSADDAH
jgi:acetyl esterase/lipase